MGGEIRELFTGEAERQSVAPKWIDTSSNLYVCKCACRARGTLLFAVVDVWHVSELWESIVVCVCVCVLLRQQQ